MVSICCTGVEIDEGEASSDEEEVEIDEEEASSDGVVGRSGEQGENDGMVERIVCCWRGKSVVRREKIWELGIVGLARV